MEDEDGVEGAELIPCDAEIESDDDGMEDDAEFEDQKGGDLLLEFEPTGLGVIVFDFLVQGFFVITFRFDTRFIGSSLDILSVSFGRDDILNIRPGASAVLDLNVTLRDEVEEEDEHDHREDDGGNPRVLRPTAGHSHACGGTYFAIGRVQEVDEGGGNDDAGTEITSEEIDVGWDTKTWDAFGDDGEEGSAGGDDHDDEEGGDTRAESAIVFIA